MNARERAQRRWFRFPIRVPKDPPFGEDVSMAALSAEEYEILAAIGPLTREELDVELRRRRRLDVDFSKYPAIGRLEQLVNRHGADTVYVEP
jgi:hypothetical protein